MTCNLVLMTMSRVRDDEETRCFMMVYFSMSGFRAVLRRVFRAILPSLFVEFDPVDNKGCLMEGM